MRDGLQRLRVLAAALAGVVAVSFMGYRYFQDAATSAALLLLLIVILAGAFARLPESIFISIVAALCLDYFFIPPVGSITIRDRQGWVALILFLLTSVSAGNIANRFHRQREQLMVQGKHTASLHEFSRSLWMAGSGEEVKRSIVNRCIELFGFHAFVLFESQTASFYRSHHDVTAHDDLLRQAARMQIEEQTADNWWILPVSLGNVPLGSIGFLPGAALPYQVLKSIANTVAIGLAQARAQTAAGQAEAVRRGEELKSLMIDALAHELKSPLTAIEASAEMLDENMAISPEQSADLLAVIREESRGLRQLMEEAIHLARIDAEKLRLQSRPTALADLVAGVVESLGDRVTGRSIRVEAPPDLPLVLADKELMSQAIKQLVDNALKYSPIHAPITIRVAESGEQQILSVRDGGTGLTEMEQSHVFDKFYRGRYDRSAIQGTGMGLAITKEIAEAHGGSVGVQSRVGHGSEFSITLRSVKTAALI